MDVARSFSEELVENRQFEIGGELFEWTYPHWEVSQAGLDKASAVLDDASVPNPVKRIVAENRDRVQRALAARECDAATGEN